MKRELEPDKRVIKGKDYKPAPVTKKVIKTAPNTGTSASVLVVGHIPGVRNMVSSPNYIWTYGSAAHWSYASVGLLLVSGSPRMVQTQWSFIPEVYWR